MTRLLLPSDEWADAAARFSGDPCTSGGKHGRRPKRRHATRTLAWCFAALIRLQSGGLQHPYHCPSCGWYHLTTAKDERKAWARRVIKRIHAGEGAP